MQAPPRDPHVPSILIVDDTPDNLQLLFRMLNGCGYNARPVSSGRLALDAARMSPPDLILLDINMPDMDGYAVCEELKADSKLREIPVIFISAMNGTLNKVKAFGAGGVDYITKPFQADEVAARIKTHLDLTRLQVELKTHNADLEEQVRLRTVQLGEANSRLSILDKAKSDFLTLISHELRTPLNGMFGIAELIFDECPLTPETAELQEHFDNCRERILSIVQDALLLTQIEVESDKFSGSVSSFGTALTLAVHHTENYARPRKVFFGASPHYTASIFGESQMLTKALEALLETAVRFSNPGSLVRLSGSTSESEVFLVIETTGRGIPPDAISRFFDVLAIAEAIIPGGDLGLRLPVAERIITLFGGSVTVENLDYPGIRMSVRLNRLHEDPKSGV